MSLFYHLSHTCRSFHIGKLETDSSNSSSFATPGYGGGLQLSVSTSPSNLRGQPLSSPPLPQTHITPHHSYPRQDVSVNTVPPDTLETSRTHYRELIAYLTSHSAANYISFTLLISDGLICRASQLSLCCTSETHSFIVSTIRRAVDGCVR